MTAIAKYLGRSRLVLALLLALCAAALAGAFSAEHLFGIEPCVLCIYQRIPYAVVGALCLIGLVWTGGANWQWLILGLCAFGFLAESGIAIFHMGVEQHWWDGTAECAGSIPVGLSIDELRDMLTQAPPVRCDEIRWTLLGLSVTVYNTVIGLSAAAVAGMAAVLAKRGRA
ncbi:MAG: disulfide bond formation protein B [Magnetospiraceae bacterium]